MKTWWLEQSTLTSSDAELHCQGLQEKCWHPWIPPPWYLLWDQSLWVGPRGQPSTFRFGRGTAHFAVVVCFCARVGHMKVLFVLIENLQICLRISDMNMCFHQIHPQLSPLQFFPCLTLPSQLNVLFLNSLNTFSAVSIAQV